MTRNKFSTFLATVAVVPLAALALAAFVLLRRRR